jgi:hypothetical protein
LGTAELKVGGVDFATENLVQSGRTGENDGGVLNLNGTLTEADEIGTDT